MIPIGWAQAEGSWPGSLGSSAWSGQLSWKTTKKKKAEWIWEPNSLQHVQTPKTKSKDRLSTEETQLDR